jgi:hypothetical protein
MAKRPYLAYQKAEKGKTCNASQMRRLVKVSLYLFASVPFSVTLLVKLNHNLTLYKSNLSTNTHSSQR